MALAPYAVIEDDYTGPKLEDGMVTVKFMKDMMHWFKEQKKLHRKCAYQVGKPAFFSFYLPFGNFKLTCMLSESVVSVVSNIFFQILVQVKEVLAKLPSLVEISLKEVRCCTQRLEKFSENGKVKRHQCAGEGGRESKSPPSHGAA